MLEHFRGSLRTPGQADRSPPMGAQDQDAHLDGDTTDQILAFHHFWAAVFESSALLL